MLSYVLLSIKNKSLGVWSLFPPLLVEIGEVLPCNGGVGNHA